MLSHHWLRHQDDAVFHAYTKGRDGSPTLCRRGKPFEAVRTMDIPGTRSICCKHCVAALYGPVSIGATED